MTSILSTAFAAALDLRPQDAEFLRQELLEAARSGEAVWTSSDSFGDRYRLDFELNREGKRGTIRSVWIVPPLDSIPRLVSCWVK